MEPKTPQRRPNYLDIASGSVPDFKASTGLRPSPYLNDSPNLEHPSSPTRSITANNASPRPDFSPARSPQFADVETSPLRSPSTPTQDLPTRIASTTPRLVIQKLVLINFKSYAGRQEIGPFNTNFSAVVGPNGSGKSNVIDSLLFVFGFRATKMRHTRLTALIHKSEAFPDLQEARVEVHFEEVIDTPLGSEKIQGSELVISREISHSSGSSYFINNRSSTYTEVTSLLKGRGIDLDHKRFLILQGEVESIALMKPKADGEGDDGLLEYLEDIIGTSQYKQKIKETEGQLEGLKTEVGEKRGRMEISERDLDQLDNKRKDIAFYMKHHNIITVARSSLYQIEMHNAAAEESQATTNLQAAKQELCTEKGKINDLEGDLKKYKLALDSASHDLKKAESAVSSKEKLYQQAKMSHVKLKTRLQQLQVQSRKVEKTVQATTNDSELARAWLKNFALDRDHQLQLQQKLAETLENEEKALEDIQATLQDKTKVFSDRIEKIQREVEPWRVKIQTKEASIAKLKSDLSFMKARQEEDLDKWKETTRIAQEISDQGMKSAAHLKSLQQEQRQNKDTFQKVEDDLSTIDHTMKTLAQKVATQRAAVASARDSRQAQQSQDRMLSALLEMRDKDELHGFYGRLGSLATIEKQFDVAVSTSCPRLDDFVVDTVETGQKCIQLLRKNKLGTARFILLDQQSPPVTNMTTPPGVSRLYDLIKVENPHFLSAFYSVMGDTLVARTPDEARRIAFGGNKRYRVVSLQGVLIEPSGTMSGGGEPSRGKMMIRGSAGVKGIISAETMGELEQTLASLEMELLEARSTKQELENQRQELKERISKSGTEIAKTKLAFDQLTQQMNDAKSKRRELKTVYEKRLEADGPSRESAEVNIGVLENEKQVLLAESGSLEQEIADLQERILAAGGIELRMQSSKVNDLREKSSSITDQLAQLNDERARQETLVKRYESTLEDAQRELGCVGNDLLAIQSQINQSEKQELNLAAELEGEHARSIAATDKAQDLTDTLEQTQNAIDELSSAVIELRKRVENQEARKRSASKHIQEFESKLDKLHVYDLRQAADLRYPEEVEPLPQLNRLNKDELERLDVATLEQSLKTSEKLLEGRRIDLTILEDYQTRFGEYTNRRDAVNDAVERYEKLEACTKSLKQRRFEEFMDGFQTISDKLKEMYQMITMGGNAELELVDHLDPFAEGILFSVMPPKKSWRNIANLSGGEKTLSSLALVFALHHYKPTPLYVMDEIDAALDFRNVSIVANYIKERTTNGQFIVISLRNNMFELASRLVGIYKVNNMTRSVTIVNNPVSS
ncbi:Structural maintenance of chromosomes protein 4 [Wickerhamiella sorbophila]|uniref:Structural maintenance of chromosomes protein n=1 Tax=Wickerhamiella sorbophila TaxID=45607 RepID=A0A2T0FEM3_9ASCO|nr:Structural maintenance of chromosomes protein 4 [Wickerhamiella sorbophila]PRT53420.1 Structural maintenance of chromosomes protein 4 [Wickerhamiella sorbophila]